MVGALNRRDPLTTDERSARMSRVRSTGNRSTEFVVEAVLRAGKITGWRKHPHDIPGRPDFYFPQKKLAVFVDGCFWHACPRCARRMPRSRRKFWKAKLLGNQQRDNRLRRLLVRRGFKTMRLWEHELRESRWLGRLQRRLGLKIEH
jgi:DNA mismatch endonuclease, patch repair protein